VGLPGQQRPSERLWATTPRRLADKPAPSLHSSAGVAKQKPRHRRAGLSRPPPGLPAYALSAPVSKPTDTIRQMVAQREGDSR
jgi:hypothetical protein